MLILHSFFQPDASLDLNISSVLMSFEIMFVSMKSNRGMVSSKGGSDSSCAVR